MVRGLLLLLLVLAAVPARAQPACDACGRPLQSQYYRMSDGRKLCAEDYERQQPRCATCGWAIVGSYVLVEGNRPVCRVCFRKYPHCFVCALPVREGGRRLSDGRLLCADHAARGVYDDDRGRIAFAQAADAVVATLGLRLKHAVSTIKVVDQKSLSSLLAEQGRFVGKDLMGLFRLQARGDERRYTVYLVSGLPPERLATVSAHEYAHVWHSENHPRYMECNDRLREGFAEWVAYKVNRRLGRQGEVDQLLAQEREEYIEGLRRFLEIEKRYGVAGVLRAATTRDRL